MPQRSKRARRASGRRSRADRLVTVVVVLFLVLVIGGAVAVQITAGRRSATVPPTLPQATVASSSAEDIQRISAQEAKQMVDAGQAVLVDVRSAASYQTAHAAGALSFPTGYEAEFFDKLPADKILIFYCT